MSIEVGCDPQGRPGFTQIFEDGERQHFLYDLATARALSWKLLDLCEKIEQATKPTGDTSRVTDHCSLKLSPPKED